MHAKDRTGLGPLALVTLGVVGLVSVCRGLGFGADIVMGATPASGLALAAALILRGRGAMAAAAGFTIAGLLWRLEPSAVLADALAQGLAAFAGAHAMRLLARRHRPDSKTLEWLVFLAGILVFTATVTLVYAGATIAGAISAPPAPRAAPLLVAVFTPLGLMTFSALVFSRHEWREVLANPRPAFGILALGAVLLASLWLLLPLPIDYVRPSGLTLLLSVPFCLWVAMQRRSLDGAAVSFVAALVALWLILHDVGAVASGDMVTTILYLNLLVATCQLVHAVNLDRLRALAENEAHKRNLEARVAERTERLRAMTEHALAADAAKSKFVATVSHEVRTPLNGVIGMASVVLASDLDPGTRKKVDVIRTSGLHLLDVINRVLEYSRIGHEPEPAMNATFDLRMIVAEVLDEARAAPHSDGVTFVTQIEQDLPPFRIGYRHGLRQILTNFVANAAKFTDAGSITVRLCRADPGVVRLEVRDTGCGIAPEVQGRIFRPFDQGDRADLRGGTGLGLSICAEIVDRMGGRIGVTSRPGIGSAFWAELPLARADREDVPLRSAIAAAS